MNNISHIVHTTHTQSPLSELRPELFGISRKEAGREVSIIIVHTTHTQSPLSFFSRREAGREVSINTTINN
jgi:hypothetical protein